MSFSTGADIDRALSLATLKGKNVIVIGGSRGLGRVILEAAHAQGARVLAVARGEGSLAEVAARLEGCSTLALDATDEGAPARVFEALDPNVLILVAGAIPPAKSLHELCWSEFSSNWQSDVKLSFLFCRAALRAPLRPGTLVILISSGAAVGGSPISGGYAGAKRMQMFLANYAQKESDRLGLDMRFLAIAPARIMPDTGVGQAAVSGYSRYLGMSAAEFIEGMSSCQTPKDVASAVVDFATRRIAHAGNAFLVSGKGIEPAP